MTIIHTSPMPAVDIPTTTITEYMLRDLDSLADRVAMIDGPSGATTTFAELAGQIRSLAGGLVARGFAVGETVAIVAPNIPAYAVVFHGVATAGGTVTTVNPTYTADEIRHQLQDSGATMLVTLSMFADAALGAVEGTSVTEVVFLDEVPEGSGGLEFASLMGEPIDQVPVDPTTHTVVLPYSSGTTGLPKGVMLSHYNLVANLCQCGPGLDYEQGEVALAALPFFHIYGMQVLMNGLLSEGVTVVSVPRFDLVQVLELIQTHKITRFFAVPPMVLALAKQPVIDNYDLSSLKMVFSGAAPLGAELAAEAAARIGCEVVQGYGMTELAPVSHLTPTGAFKAGTSGITVANTECRIVSEDGVDQPVGERGELWVRGPQVMLGYLNNDTATNDTIDADGWLHTGDVAIIDDDGHCSIVDRVKELIKYKGFQVPPAELEALLLTHTGIADAAVIGIPDEEAGELPKGYVVLKPDTELSAEEVQEFVAGQVATYKQLRMVEFRDEIPKSASGKILRRMLRDEHMG
jgi:4-coumarate--CoA ligase